MIRPIRSHPSFLLLGAWVLLANLCNAADEVPFNRFYPQEAVLVPRSQQSTLQAKLDQHGVIRLESGDYLNTNTLRSLTVRSGQRIYGLGSILPDVTIAPGSADIVMSYVHGKMTFPGTTQVSRRLMFRRTSFCDFQAVGATLEDSLFLGPAFSSFNIDNRTGGWFRNNRFIRFLTHGKSPAFVMRGDAARNSHGNVMMWANQLSPPSDMFIFENQADFTLVYIDVEGNSSVGSPAIKLERMGSMSIFSSTGHISFGRTVDSAADALWLHGHTMGASQNPSVLLRNTSQVAMVVNAGDNVSLQDDAVAPTARAIGYLNTTLGTKTITINGVNNPTNPPGIAAGTQAALGALVSTSRTGLSWERPEFSTPPNPVVLDPASQPSATDSIQAQINARGVVQLPEGTFYLDRPLTIGRGQGLIGAGMDKTVLVARNQDTDLIVNASTAGMTLADLTLKGGRNGIRLQPQNGERLLYSECIISHVTIRDMRDHGFFFQDIFGFDNNFLDYVNFVNCGTAVRQNATHFGDASDNGINYMDKVLFYQCQFIGCRRALDLYARRASAGNMWSNCFFKDNSEYVLRGVSQSSLTFANCDFVNNGGHPVVNTDGRIALVSCVFEAGAANPVDIIDAIDVSIEGCTFLASGATTTVLTAEMPSWTPFDPAFPQIPAYRDYIHRNFFYYNSSSQLRVGALRQAMIFNSRFDQNPEYTTRGAYVVNRIATTIIPGTPDPRPQLLVGSRLPSSMVSETGQVPEITSPTVVNNASAGSVFAYAITAQHFPTIFSAPGLPTWLALDTSTGLITGTPPSAGAVAITVTAGNVYGSDSQGVTINVATAVAGTPVISGSVSLTAFLETAFSYQVTASNAPTSYNASALPAGLSINTTTGVISGTPTAIGTRIASVSANNAQGTTVTSIAFRVLPKLQSPIVPPNTTPPGSTPPSSGGASAVGSGGSSGCGLGGTAAALLFAAMIGILRRQRFPH